ncbi:hypothetical protein ACLK1S_19550 [Escherichia coli]
MDGVASPAQASVSDLTVNSLAPPAPVSTPAATTTAVSAQRIHPQN